jgi:hypothetical protein
MHDLLFCVHLCTLYLLLCDLFGKQGGSLSGKRRTTGAKLIIFGLYMSVVFKITTAFVEFNLLETLQGKIFF